MTPFHDYAYYLLVIEKRVRTLNDKCLHKDYNIDQEATDIMRALSGLLRWTEDVQQKPQVEN